jgi:hypothetical protein
MRLSRLPRAALPVVAVLVALSLSTPAAGDATWSVAASPNRGHDFNRLNAVAASSATDLWAVGLARGTSGQYGTLVLRGNGTSWRVADSPSVGGSTNELNAVAARTTSDAWAVGDYYAGTAQRTLAEHFDGGAWTVVPTPNAGSAPNTLRGVAIVGPDDAWAVGSSRPDVFKPVALHFDGTAWQSVPAPVPPGGGFFNAVTAIATDDVWAVGGTGDDGDNALIEHWDGAVWHIVAAPSLLGEDSLLSVAALATKDVWAVGRVGSSNLAEHWDGRRWSVVPAPNGLSIFNGNNVLAGVVALSANDVWAVGSTLNFTAGSLKQTSILHFSAGAWTVVTAPNRGSGDNLLLGVASPAPGGLVAAGSYRPKRASFDRTLVLTAAGA